MIQFDLGSGARALELIEGIAWGDMEGAIRTFEECLARALAVTYDEFQRWEMAVDNGEFADEFSVDAETMRVAPCELKLAYVARLLRSAALMYGVGSDYRWAAAVA